MNCYDDCKYFDKYGVEVKEGDTIRFTLYDGIPNKEFVVDEIFRIYYN